MTRQRQRSEPLHVFGEWHRENMSPWYTHIDADYVGYIDAYNFPEHAYKPYIIMELIHVRDYDKWQSDTPVPQQYPIHDHKKHAYEGIDERIDVPIYVMWHPSACDEFIIRKLGDDETKQLDDKHEFADFLDDRRDDMINKLNTDTES